MKIANQEFSAGNRTKNDIDGLFNVAYPANGLINYLVAIMAALFSSV